MGVRAATHAGAQYSEVEKINARTDNLCATWQRQQ